jgi:hypothetical protein
MSGRPYNGLAQKATRGSGYEIGMDNSRRLHFCVGVRNDFFTSFG